MLDIGAAWLAGQLQQAAGSSATYLRGSQRIDVTVVRKARIERIVDEQGDTVATREHTLVIDASELGIEPRAGDRIEETVGGAATTWEVLPVSGAPCFRWWDRGRTAYEVDVVQVD